MNKKTHISIFFLFCLLNVALIPQLCLSAVQNLNNDFDAHASSEEGNGDFGFKIFEEESKEGQEENKSGSENFVKILKINSNSNLYSALLSVSAQNQHKLYLNEYSSIEITPLSPPPDNA